MKDVLEQLHRLNELLNAIPANCAGMTIGELDGYVTAIAVCPEAVPPAEWLPAIWGADGGLGEVGEAEAIAAAAMAHYHRIALELDGDPEAYAPVMEMDDPDGALLWQPWISGFERAMQLRPDAWEQIALGDDEKAAASVELIRAIGGWDRATSELTVEAEDGLDRTVPELIQTVVLSLNAWT